MSAEIIVRATEVLQPRSRMSSATPGLHIPFNSRFLGESTKPSSRAAIFLDRDGVLVRDVHHLRRPSQIELLPDVARLRSLQDRYHLIVATNQSGIARRFFTEADLLEIHSELVHQLAGRKLLVDAFYYCPHLPNAVDQAYRVACDCRKPSAGLLRRAAADWDLDLGCSYMIGDSLRDVEAGRAAGLAESFLIGDPVGQAVTYRVVQNLSAAIDTILGGVA